MRFQVLTAAGSALFLAGVAVGSSGTFQGQQGRVLPKQVQDFDYVNLRPLDADVYEAISSTQFSLIDAIKLAEERTEGTVRSAEFFYGPHPRYHLELFETKEPHRRIDIVASTTAPKVQSKIRRERIPGTPVRGDLEELENGILYWDVNVGEGPVLDANSRVKVKYMAHLLDETRFADSYAAGRARIINLSQTAVRGLGQGLVGARAGGKRKLIIPGALAFGERGNDVVPPNATVVYDVEIVEIVP